MIRKIIGAALGAKLAKNSPALGGAAGTIVATALPFVLSRVTLPGMALIGVGAYILNRHQKAVSAEQAAPPPSPATGTDRPAGPAN